MDVHHSSARMDDATIDEEQNAVAENEAAASTSVDKSARDLLRD